MSKIVRVERRLRPTNFILDLYPDTPYFYSLNRGKYTSDIVCRIRNSNNEFQDFTPEALQDGDFTSFNLGNETRLNILYNQGTVDRHLIQSNPTFMPNVGNPNLYTFNDRIYISSNERNSFLESDIRSALLDSDSTVYIVFKSQELTNICGVFEEVSNTIQNRIVVYSDTRISLFRHCNYTPSSSNNFINFLNQQPTESIRLYALRRTGNLIEAFDENGLIASITSADTFSDETLFVLLKQSVGGLFFRGHLAEAMIRAKSDTEEDLNTIINHRKAFYGIN